MREKAIAIACGLGALALGLALANAIISSQPVAHAQAHHAYEPFTVEVAVRDL